MLLLTHGTHPDARDKVDGNTPQIIAAGKGYKDVAEVLLANGADVNAADQWARRWRGRYTPGTATLLT
jgi:ankyrin repeat protein